MVLSTGAVNQTGARGGIKLEHFLSTKQATEVENI